ncbi:MAG TPA: hypothetical protein DIT25_02505 [Candidatus Moranbacteria bacterium]|nr:hypothetical protein [Candidatus Moranbacteria bacterium]
MSKSKIFLILSLSFIVGIFARSFFEIDLFSIYVLSILSVISLSLFYQNKIILISGSAVLFFVFGIWLTGNKLAELNSSDLDGKNYSGQAVIIKEPASKDSAQQIVAKIKDENEAEKILLRAGRYPEYSYGDRLEIGCKFQIPENFSEDFDYRMYLAKDGIRYVCNNPKIKIVGKDGASAAYAALLKVRKKFENNINQLIPFPQSGLLSGLLLGGSAGLPKEVQDNFSRTGMTHIVAVSGYNVTIIANYLMLFGIFLGLWRKRAFWAAIFGIFLFVAIIGFPASAVRAGVMGSLLLWAMKNGRLANSQNAIFFSGAIMLLINPLLLRWDIGFQLSFLATLGIVYLFPHFENMLNKKSGIYWIGEILFLSLSAQIFVYPIILYNFHNLSLVSLLANVLVLPIIPITMALGFFMALFKFIFPPLASVLAWLTFLPLKYEVEIINILASFQFSAVEIKNFPWWGVLLWYFLLAVGIRSLRKV